jgi:hypothetical protein
MASVAYYITAGTQSNLNNNIDKANVLVSFANFVCTGADALDKTNAGLALMNAYANTVQAITKTPNDSISGYLEAMKALRGREDSPLTLPPINSDQFSQCRENVVSDLKFPLGYPAVLGQGEAVGALALVDTVQKLVGSIQTLIKDGLKIATEAEQKRVLQSFIKMNKDNFDLVLKQDLSSDELAKALEKRRRTALAIPYLYFQDMLKLSLLDNKRELLLRASEVDAALAEYDSLRMQPAPSNVAKAFKGINERLDAYANNQISTLDFVQFLAEISKELGQVKTDYDAIISGTKPAPPSSAKK